MLNKPRTKAFCSVSYHMIGDEVLNVKTQSTHGHALIHTNTPIWVRSVCYCFDTRAAGATADDLVSGQRLRGSADLGGDEGEADCGASRVLKCKTKQAVFLNEKHPSVIAAVYSTYTNVNYLWWAVVDMGDVISLCPHALKHVCVCVATVHHWYEKTIHTSSLKKLQTKAEPAGNSADATVSKSSGIRSQAVLTFISIRQHVKKGLLNKIQKEYCYSWTCWV